MPPLPAHVITGADIYLINVQRPNGQDIYSTLSTLSLFFSDQIRRERRTVAQDFVPTQILLFQQRQR